MAIATEGFKFFQSKTPLPTLEGINYSTVVVRGVIFDENSPGYENSLDIGSILFNTTTELSTTEDEQLFKFKARPLFSNITQYPLINELVVVLGLPSIQTQNEGDSVNLYYFPPVSLWNNAYANYFKAKGLSSTTELTNFSNELVNQGIPNKTNRATIQSSPPSLPEDKKVYGSLQKKGDITYEGRFGNLIKFTSIQTPETPEPIKPQKIQKGKIETLYFESGESQITQEFILTLQSIGRLISKFKQTYPNAIAYARVIGSESLPPNPKNLPQNELAALRAKNLVKIVNSLENFVDKVSSEVVLGNIPYSRGINDPRDPKYKDEQYVRIEITWSATKLPKTQYIEPEYSPLTIIKNGNPDNVFSTSARIPENINQDKSSIYLTHSGSINMDTGIRNNISYLTPENIPENTSQYSKNQVIINSGRILLNSKTDHTMIYGHKSINLNSLGTINIQSNNEVVIIGKELYLNSNNKSEPVILGESLFQVLDLLLQQLEFFSSAVSTSVSTPVGAPLGPMNTTALQLNTTIQQLREILPDIKSKTTFTN